MRRRFESYRLSRRAERDLEDIHAYTAARWSLAQADRYIREIQATLLGLVDGEKTGRLRPDVTADYLFCPAGSHLIVYRETDLILVARVLHASMDLPSLLMD